MEFSKAISFISKVKTPLTVSGLSFIVFYFIYDKVLSLEIFEKLSEDNTFKTINNILEKVFWLAIIALFLGVLSYFFNLYVIKKNQKGSDLELLEVSNDSNKSFYCEAVENGEKTISK